ncbi:hydrolase, alpha/beta hydrolase fold family [alpha proteobacterium U9-1i]|nr:hydrolase, alpha/beta hydrolase fold family [alpha proteobacterium U9-1i]
MRHWLLGLVALAGCATAPEAPIFASGFEPAPCLDQRFEGQVRCGRILTPEDHTRPDGRLISLHVVIIPAVTPQPHAAPLYFIDGGPGSPATRRIGFYLGEGALYRQRRDVVLFDQRGAGSSNPLHCPEISFAPNPADPMYPEGSVARCRDALSVGADLSLYTTAASARDIDVVRATLGHEQIDIYAASYGTTLSLYYMGMSPARVRAAVLVGAAPWWAMPPRQHAVAAERALRLVFAECAADAACHAAYPDLPGDLDRALARLPSSERSPRREMFMEQVRRAMYSPAGARQTPKVIHNAARDGLEPDTAPSAAPLPQPDPLTFSEGLYLSITCAESILRMEYESAARQARSTSFGDYRLRFQRAACSDWSSRRASDRAPSLRRVRAPVLLLSGYIDPVTPPQWAAEAQRALPNARQFLIPAAAHTNGGLSNVSTCFDPLVQGFYDNPDLQRVNPACLAQMRPPPFAVD